MGVPVSFLAFYQLISKVSSNLEELLCLSSSGRQVIKDHSTGPWEAVGMETKASYQVGESSAKPVGNHVSEGQRRSRRDS